MPKWTIVTVAVVHILWAGMLYLNSSVANTTPVAPLASNLNAVVALPTVLLLASFAALYGVFFSNTPKERIMAVIPQQLLVLVSAFGAIGFALGGSYADGVVRPITFILADQLPLLALAAIQTQALIQMMELQWDSVKLRP